MSRRELEGVLAHELSHIRNRDVQVTTLAVTTVGILVAVAEIAARMSWFADWGDDDDNGGGALALIAVAILAGILAFGARILSLAISRHREELADVSAAELVSPGGLRKALEKLEADHTVIHHVSRATAHLWLEAPLRPRRRRSQSQAQPDVRLAPAARRTHRDPAQARRARPRTAAARSTRRAPASPSTSQHLAQSTGLRTSPSLLEVRGPVGRLAREHADRTRAGSSAADGAPVDDPQTRRESARLVPPRRDDAALLERQCVHRLDGDVERHALGAVAGAS